MKDRNILVTGSTSGIGLAITDLLINNKCNVFLHGRDEVKLRKVGLDYGIAESQLLLADLKNSNEIESIIDQIPSLDGIVFNAGINKLKTINAIKRKDLLEIFQVNLFSNVILLKLLMKNKKINNNASLVFVSSMSGFYRSSVGNSIYSASKSAMDALMRHAALELAPKNIRVNGVNPGAISTRLMDELSVSQENIHDDKLLYPLKRYGNPNEVAELILFLLSDKSTFMTGSSILVDGGFTLR
jgi:NAD(P)-dependent dehydrogenase (short-subunit alcohol dehydrogenase family)